MKIIDRCVRCKSVWVCWNWFVSPGRILHECWNCAASWSTPGEVTRGVPYWMLRLIGSHLVNHEQFEKNLTEDLSAAHDWLDEAEWDDENTKK